MEENLLSSRAQKMAESRLAAKRAARAEARDIRMKELERQQKEMSDDDERMSVGSRGSLRCRHNGMLPVTLFQCYCDPSDLERLLDIALVCLLPEQSDFDSAAAYGGLIGDSVPYLLLSLLMSLSLSVSPFSWALSGSPRSPRNTVVSRAPAPVLPPGQARPAPAPWDPAALPPYRLRLLPLWAGLPPGEEVETPRSQRIQKPRSERLRDPAALPPYRLRLLPLWAGLPPGEEVETPRSRPIQKPRSERLRVPKWLIQLKRCRRERRMSHTAGTAPVCIRKEAKLCCAVWGLAADSLAEVEEKYRKAMVSNAQLDNEKSNFMFQVDTMKDSLMELEEQLAETRRELDEKVKEHERERHAHSVLQFQFNEMKENLRQSEELLAEIRQLKLKQESSVREVSDSRDCLAPGCNKERQKEYFDVIRTERDELRDEIVLLQDVIKKHGIVLGAELKTNGEVSNTVLDSTVHADSVKRSVPDSTPVLQTPGDGLIGKATEVEMKISLLADVGNKEILQSAGDEAEKQESLDDDAETQEVHVGEKAQENLAENEQLASVPSDDTLNDPGDVQQREQSDIASQASSYLLETAETDSTLGSNAIAQSSVDDINQNDIHEHSPVLELTYSVDDGIVAANSLIAEGEIMSERETEVINREDEGGKEVVQVIITGPDDEMESETEQALSDKEAETTEKGNSDGQQSVQSAEEMRIEGGETKTQEESLDSNKEESVTGSAVTDKVSDEENAEHEVAQDPTEKVDEANSTGKERVQKAADSYFEGKKTQEEGDVKQVTEEVEVESLLKVLGEGNAEKVEHEMAPDPTEKVDEANCTGEERVQTAKGTNIEGKETREENLDGTNLEGSTATEGDVKQVAEKVEVKGLVKVLGEGDAIYEQGEIDELVEEKEPVASTGNEEKVEHEIAPGPTEKVDEANCTGEGRVQKAEDTHIEGKETQEESIDSTNVKQITEKVEVEGLAVDKVLEEEKMIPEEGEVDKIMENKEPGASTGSEEKVEHEIAQGPTEKVEEKVNHAGDDRVRSAEDINTKGTQDENIDSTDIMEMTVTEGDVKQVTEKVGDKSLVQLEKTGITGECQEELDSDVVKSKDASSCEVQKEHEEQKEVTMETKAEQIEEEVTRECVIPSLEHGQESGEIEGSEKAPQSIAIGEPETLCNDSTVMEEVTVRSDVQAGNEKQEFVYLETETKQEEVVLAGDGMTPTMVHHEPDSEDKGVNEKVLPHRPEDEPEVSCESDTTNNNVEGVTDENDSKEKHGEDLTTSCFVEEVDQGEVSIPLEDKGEDIEEAKNEVGNSSQKDEGEELKQDDLKEDSEKKVQSQKTEDQNKEDKLENETNLESQTAAEQGVEGIANVETVHENIMGRVVAQGSGDDVKEEPLFGGEGQKVISEDHIETIEEETRTVNKEVKGTESQNIDPAVVKDVIESKGETIVQCEICVEKVDVELDHQDNYLDEEIHPENLETVGTVTEDSKPSDNSELAPAEKVASQSTVEVETLKEEKINQGLEPTVTAADNIKSECMLPDGSEQEKTDIGKETDETVVQQTTADISEDAILEEMATAEKKVDVFNLEKERESKDQEHEHQDEAQEVKQEVTSKEEVKEKSTEKVEENIPDDVQEKEQAPATEKKQDETQLTQKEVQEEKGEAEEEEEEEGEEDNEEDEEGEKFEFDDEVGQDLEESDQKVFLEDPLKEKETQQQGAETNDSSPMTKTDSQDKEQRSEKGDVDQLKTQDSESEKTGGEPNQKEMEEVCSAGSQGNGKESGERGQQGEDGNKQGDIGRELEKELGEGTKRQSISEDSVGEPVGQMPDSVQDTEDSKSGSTEDLGKQDAAKGKIRLRKLVDERESLLEQIRKLKAQLDDKKRNVNVESVVSEEEVLENGTDVHVMDLQRDSNRQISDLKFKLVKSEQEVTTLEQNVIRLEGQVTRYKSASENAEKVEDDLKAEKRKLQRELRTALDKINELEVGNSHLVKRLEKMKANRSALMSQQ
ncbi:UNVERIFIED_CONTAM: hypothetical protein FKN15_057775 [Acipenser sinensis]